jgi:C4-dicarboxylate transporter
MSIDVDTANMAAAAGLTDQMKASLDVLVMVGGFIASQTETKVDDEVVDLLKVARDNPVILQFVARLVTLFKQNPQAVGDVVKAVGAL